MECDRDVEIARSLGFKGEVFPPFPVTGGYEIVERFGDDAKTTTSARRVILVKGHTRFVGRGTQALAALSALAELLKEYEIVVYSADSKAKRFARKIRKQFKVKVSLYGRGELAHQELLEIFELSRIYVGISLSDGISVSLQEAMVCGAFPIQTNTSCADEWIVNGKSGFIVSPDDHAGLVKAISIALQDDTLVDNAAQINYEVARNRLDRSIISEISKNFYESLV
jgi:glycosyltransferase involved in cell wall biosynthesis